MPAILVALLVFMGEDAAVALFTSLCLFAVRCQPIFDLLSEVPGPSAPARSRIVHAAGELTESGMSAAVTAARPYYQQYIPHTFHFGLNELRAACRYVKEHGADPQRIGTLVREAWHRAQQGVHPPHPPAPHPPAPHPTAPHAPAHPNAAHPPATSHGQTPHPASGHGSQTSHRTSGGAGHNSHPAVTGGVSNTTLIQNIMHRNNLVMRHVLPGSETWALFLREANGSERQLGIILKAERATHQMLADKVERLLAINNRPFLR